MKKVALTLLLFPMLSFANDISVIDKSIVVNDENKTLTVTFPPENRASGLQSTTGFSLTVPEGRIFNTYIEDDYKGVSTSYKAGAYDNVILRSVTVAWASGSSQYPDTSDYGVPCFSALADNPLGDFAVTLDQAPKEVIILMNLINLRDTPLVFNVDIAPAMLTGLGNNPKYMSKYLSDNIETDYWININDRASDLLPKITDWSQEFSAPRLTVQSGKDFFAQFNVNIGKYGLNDINTLMIAAREFSSFMRQEDVQVSNIEAFCK